MKRANLGCGEDYREGWLNVDYSNVAADEQYDLRKFHWPWGENEFDEVLMQGVIEHLPDTRQTITEVWRMLKPGGVFSGSFPYCGSHFAFRDPTHVRYFDEKIFDYWTLKPVPWTAPARFKVRRIELCCYSDKVNQKLRNLIPGRRLLRYFFWNMYDLVEFELIAEKHVHPAN